jgi:uncharacterized membrane protein
MNPWDPIAAISAKHAQHVVLIHFPIALFITGVVFDVIAKWKRRADLAFVAYCNFSGALLMAVPTVLTGLLAWRWELEGRRLKGILLLHLLSGWTSLALIAAVWWLHRKSRRNGGLLPASVWLLEFVALIAVIITGHLGGFLSGVNHP